MKRFVKWLHRKLFSDGGAYRGPTWYTLAKLVKDAGHGQFLLGFQELFRLSIAEWLDRHRLDTCRAELIMWALFPACHDFGEIFYDLPMRGLCLEANNWPFCGKCQVLQMRESEERLRLRQIFYGLRFVKS